MSSSLTLQLRQHQHQQKEEQKLSSSVASNDGHASVGNVVAAVPPSTVTSLPSPPNSSYGDESSSVSVGEKEDRRNSLPSHFNALTLQHFSTLLPENYTIEHPSSPIPIVSSSPRLRHKHHYHHHQRRHHHRSESPSFLLSPTATATAAATGGLTIRGNNTRMIASSLPSCPSSSSSFSPTTTASQNNSVKQKHSTSATTTKALHRCGDCGKVYKHPNCLTKHRWEHSEEWVLTSKLLLTKHQQVQMLEAAAILVSLDTQRVDQQRMLEEQEQIKQQKRHHIMTTDTEEDDDGYQGNGDVSIHIDDDNDDDDITVDMEMDE